MNGLMAVFVLLGVFFVVLSLPLMLRRVPPNSSYGLRTRATATDENVWYDANAAGGRDFALVGVALVITALGLRPLAYTAPPVYAICCVGVLVVAGGIAAVVGTARANRMLRERRNPRQRRS